MFINLTNHPVTDLNTGLTFQPIGTVATVKSSTSIINKHCGVPIQQTTMAKTIDNLPEPQPDTYYIVSAQCLNASNREDLVCPGSTKRDSRGYILGCWGFRTN